MHAKMTRDRKKSFISTIEKTIEDLEANNRRMKDVIITVTQTHFKSSSPLPGVTPISSPDTCSVVSHDDVPPLHNEQSLMDSPHLTKRVQHGFNLVP